MIVARRSGRGLVCFIEADHEEMKKLWTDTEASLSNFKMTPDFIVADERGGAASFTMTGKYTGDFPG